MRLIVVGRDPKQASLVISNDYVSGYHAEIIQLDNGDMYIVDKSANGTYINGNRLTPGKEYPLKRGSQVAFADSLLDWSRIPEITVPSNVKKIISIGSHYMNTIKLQSPNVSRFHATIRQMNDGKWFICDHSLNGTTVNGVRIPKDAFVPLNPKDAIVCADQSIENPARGSKSSSSNNGLIAILAACVCVLLGLGAFLYFNNREFSDQQLCQRYERSVGLMICSYHFEVKCGSLDISDLPDPDYPHSRKLYSKFIIEDDKIFEYDGENSIVYTGTGFFVGNDGLVVSNRHIACPWENSTTSEGSDISAIEAAEEYFKAKLTKLYELGYTEALQYISQVEVTGELDKAVIIPNGDYLDAANAISLHVETVSPNDIDLALFKIRASSFPAEVKSIKIKKIKATEPKIGAKILTIGFPFGIYLLDGKTQIQSNFSNGSISRTDKKNKFGFTAPTFHGASGSPVFDSKGNLIGIVSAGIDITQGFNEAERASCLIDLLR